MSKRITTIYHRWMRWQYDFNRRLCRGGLVAIALVFAIAVFGPLACVVHCALLDALYPASALHLHHSHAMANAVSVHQHGAVAVVATTAPESSVPTCHMTDDSGKPAHAPLAQALYELAPTSLPTLLSPTILVGIALFCTSLLLWRPSRPLLPPPQFA